MRGVVCVPQKIVLELQFAQLLENVSTLRSVSARTLHWYRRSLSLRPEVHSLAVPPGTVRPPRFAVHSSLFKQGGGQMVSVYIISEVRSYRDALELALGSTGRINVLGCAGHPVEAFA